MNLHGGSVDIESVVGEGTVARATFPRSRFIAPQPADLQWQAN